MCADVGMTFDPFTGCCVQGRFVYGQVAYMALGALLLWCRRQQKCNAVANTGSTEAGRIPIDVSGRREAPLFFYTVCGFPALAHVASRGGAARRPLTTSASVDSRCC